MADPEWRTDIFYKLRILELLDKVMTKGVFWVATSEFEFKIIKFKMADPK